MADLLPLNPDELLTTTRAVRKRLDLTRPVERSVVERCIEIAMQAPSGSNRQTWQFVLVDDPAVKQQLADLYGSVFDSFSSSTPAATFDETDTRAQRKAHVNASAQHLRDHLHEVPVMTPDAVLNDVASGRFEGWPAIRAFFGQGLAKWDDLELLPDEFWVNEDGLALHYVMSATVKDADRFGPEHVGKKWSVEVMSLLRFDGDRICYEADFHAPGARNRSLGIG